MKVRIYKPSKNAMQSGRGKAQGWVVEPEPLTARLPDNLMGWQSSGDTFNQIKLSFSTKDEAVRFCEEKGWLMSVEDEKTRRIEPRNYSDNFK